MAASQKPKSPIFASLASKHGHPCADSDPGISPILICLLVAVLVVGVFWIVKRFVMKPKKVDDKPKPAPPPKPQPARPARQAPKGIVTPPDFNEGLQSYSAPGSMKFSDFGPSPAAASANAGPGAMDLESEDQFAKLSSSPEVDFVIMFFGNGCGHCHAMMPAFLEAAKKAPIPFLRAESGKFSNVMQALNIRGVPTIFRYNHGKQIQYNGDRSTQSLLAFAN